MAETRKYGFGIVGCGMGAFTHAANFLEMDRAESVACYGRDPAKAEAFREKWKMKKAYSDYDAFLADPEIEIIVIVVPNGLHRDFSVKAANAGKHIVLEKPFDITLAKAIEQIKACEKNNVKLSGIYQMRFCKCAEKIKQAIDDGKFGDLIHIDIVDKEYRDEQYYGGPGIENPSHLWTGKKALAGGGCLTTQSTHVLDLMQWFMGGQCGNVKKIFAKSRTAKHAIGG
jgi:predicted dehydrogenase